MWCVIDIEFVVEIMSQYIQGVMIVKNKLGFFKNCFSIILVIFFVMVYFLNTNKYHFIAHYIQRLAFMEIVFGLGTIYYTYKQDRHEIIQNSFIVGCVVIFLNIFSYLIK